MLCLIIPSPPQPLAKPQIFLLYSFAFSRMSYSWNHRVYSLFRLLASLSNMHLRSLRVFSWLDVSVFVSNVIIPLCGCTMLYLSIYLLKDILMLSKFWQLWKQLLHISTCRFLCGCKLSAPLGKYQKVQLLDHMVIVRLVLQEITDLSSKVATSFCILTSDE